MLDKLDRFHNSRPGLVLFALIELALAYLFISWAINDGNWLDYLFALLFTVGFLQNFFKLLRTFVPRRTTVKRGNAR